MSSKWVPEVRHHCPDIPIVLIGLKTDLRSHQKKEDCISVADAENLARKIEACCYLECAAIEGCTKEVNAVFDTAIRAGIHSKKGIPLAKGRCLFPPSLPPAPKSPTIYPSNSQIAKDREKLLSLGEQLSDCVICCKEENIFCHQMILRSSSVFFEDMLSKEKVRKPFHSLEERNGVIFLSTHCEFEIMSSVIRFLYCGKPLQASEDVEHLARELELSFLENYCENCKTSESEEFNESISTYVIEESSKKLLSYFEDLSFNDMTFSVKDPESKKTKLFACNRAMLMSRSKVMENFLSPQKFLEGRKTNIDLG